VIDLLLLAANSNAALLKRRCIKHINQTSTQIMHSARWRAFAQNEKNSALLAELYKDLAVQHHRVGSEDSSDREEGDEEHEPRVSLTTSPFPLVAKPKPKSSGCCGCRFSCRDWLIFFALFLVLTTGFVVVGYLTLEAVHLVPIWALLLISIFAFVILFRFILEPMYQRAKRIHAGRIFSTSGNSNSNSSNNNNPIAQV